jgi:acyl-CoA synthetase (NDP forming)
MAALSTSATQSADRGSGRGWVSPDRIAQLLTPSSVAVVGASEKSPWSRMALANFRALEFDGPVHLVNPRGATVDGRPVHPSCKAIGEPIDLALLLTPAGVVEEVLVDAAAAGARSAVLLAGGFAETDSHALEQERVAELARELDVALVGPNCLGFANVLDRKSGWVGTPPSRLVPGPLAIVSQSGAVGSTLLRHAIDQDLGVSHLVTTGNQACLNILDVVGALLEDPRVRAIAVFAESLASADHFFEIAARARELSKGIVMLKAGRSSLAAEIAQSHTGALVGDDRLVDTALRQAGVVRVRSLEELITTAALLANTGPLGPGGVYFISPSGGACDLIADTADAIGLAVPQPSTETLLAFKERLPPAAVARNPLDVTGAVLTDRELMADTVRLAAGDDVTALVACIGPVPAPSNEALLRGLAEGLAAGGVPGVLITQTAQSLDPEVRQTARACDAPHLIPGLDNAIAALGQLVWWSERLRQRAWQRSSAGAAQSAAPAAEAMSEAGALALLREHGVPTPPWRLAISADEAASAAGKLGMPVVVKVCSAAIAHKSDFGGVLLNLDGPDAVAAAFASVTSRAAAAHPDAAIDGVIVAAQRPPGLELLVGVVADATWGQSLTVGFGAA